jgi:hypothetical protein
VYTAPAAASARSGQPFALTVQVANLGSATWGRPATRTDRGIRRDPARVASDARRAVGRAELLPAGRDASRRHGKLDPPAGIAPGKTVTAQFNLTAPAAPGEYLIVLDVVDPEAGSMAALGIPPGIVRVTVGL